MQQAVQRAPPPCVVAQVQSRWAARPAGRRQRSGRHSQARPRPSGRRACVAQAADEGLPGGVAPPVANQLRIPVGDREIVLETGEIGRQASGAVLASDGETMIYTTACAVEDNIGDGSFAPLQVHYTERFSAAGRTSGGYLKREGKPKDHEVLVARLIDRPIRPMIQSGWTHSTQVLTWVMSYDGQHSPEPLAITAAGAALAISGVPLRKAVAGARVGLLPGRGFVVNPSVEEQAESRLDLLVAGTAEAVLMIEGFCDFLSEEEMLEAVRCGHDAIKTMCHAIEGWAAQVGKPKNTEGLKLPPEGLDERVQAMIGAELEAAYRGTNGKKERGEIVGELRQRVRDALVEPSAAAQLAAQLAAAAAAPGAAVTGAAAGAADSASEESSDEEGAAAAVAEEEAAQQGAATPAELAALAAEAAAKKAAAGGDGPRYEYATVQMALKRVESAIMRRLVLEEGYRADGRGTSDVRPIWSRAGLLPRTHGSVLFTRGETQAIAVTTLGCSRSAQRVDTMSAEDDTQQRFYLQYSFPPSSVGEVGRVGGPGRREVGHGNLAERALLPVVPDEAEFPYTIRVESTITESNGSSSMASVCGGCLSMMDAGVPLKRMVAGVAMGLVLEPDGRFVVLTDILGTEDALGDMDFKVAGDENGITAFQMDIKVEGITLDIMQQALEAARAGRRHILGEMSKCSPPPRCQLSPYAPRIRTMQLPLDKVGLAIGPGGRTIKQIEEATGVEVQIDGDSGSVTFKGDTEEACQAAYDLMERTIADVEIGRTYRNCRVVTVMPFGAFVEVLPKREGLLHVSEFGLQRVAVASDVLKEGDLVDVVVLDVSGDGKIKLSRKAVLVAEGLSSSPSSSDGAPPPPPTPPLAAPPPRRSSSGGGGSSGYSSGSEGSGNGGSRGRGGDRGQMPMLGDIFRGCPITSVASFGAFVKVGPGREGLLRVSEWAPTFTPSIEEVARPGDLVDVMVIDVGPGDKFKLSRKAVLAANAMDAAAAAAEEAAEEVA